jgi:hypothetical protein
LSRRIFLVKQLNNILDKNEEEENYEEVPIFCDDRSFVGGTGYL